MIHALPAPVKGATHFRREEVAINQQHGFLLLRGTVGTALTDGSELDPTMPQWPLTVAVQDADYWDFLGQHGSAVQPAFTALLNYLDAKELWR